MSQEKQMTKRVWGLTDRRPCGSADREDKRTIRNVWVMGTVIIKTMGTRENNKETTSPMTSAWSGVWTCDQERIDEAMDLSLVGRARPILYKALVVQWLSR